MLFVGFFSHFMWVFAFPKNVTIIPNNFLWEQFIERFDLNHFQKEIHLGLDLYYIK